MDELITTPIQLFGAFGFGVACLVIALKWLSKDRDEIVAQLQAERMTLLNRLEDEVTECRQDRARIQAELTQLQAEFRELLREIAATRPAAEINQ